MRGGMFSGNGSPPVVVTDSENLPNIVAGTDDISKGGLFAESGTNIVAGKTGEEWADDARRYAEYSGKWAVGPTDFEEDTLTGFTDANNSKAYSEDASRSAVDAATSATEAATSAGEASQSAMAAENSATQAATSATEAATSATEAAASATEADSDKQAAQVALAGAQAAEAAAEEAARQAQEDSEGAAISAFEADSDKVAAQDAANRSAVSAGEAATSAAQAAMDSEQTAVSRIAAERAAAEAAYDSEQTALHECRTRAYVIARGPCAGVWASTDANDGNHEYTHLPNGTHSVFYINNSTQNVDASGVALYFDHAETTAPFFDSEFGIVPVGQWTIRRNGPNQIEVVTPGAQPVGTRIDAFITDVSQVPGYESLPWQTELAEEYARRVIGDSDTTYTFTQPSGNQLTVTNDYDGTSQTFTFDEDSDTTYEFSQPADNQLKVLPSEGDSEVFTFTDPQAQIEWRDQRDQTTYVPIHQITIAADTGLELDSEAGYWRIREYVPAAFDITFAAPANRSWFDSTEHLTLPVTATQGTLNTLTFVFFTPSGQANTGITDHNATVEMLASAFNNPGQKTVSVTASGTNTKGGSATASHTVNFDVYQDYFTDINGTITRHGANLTNGVQITAHGPTYVEVIRTINPTFTDSIGTIPNSELVITNITKTENSVTREYKRIYLGNYVDANTFTVGGL